MHMVHMPIRVGPTTVTAIMDGRITHRATASSAGPVPGSAARTACSTSASKIRAGSTRSRHATGALVAVIGSSVTAAPVDTAMSVSAVLRTSNTPPSGFASFSSYVPPSWAVPSKSFFCP